MTRPHRGTCRFPFSTAPTRELAVDSVPFWIGLAFSAHTSGKACKDGGDLMPKEAPKKKKIWSWVGGLGVGLINGLLGAGGGMLAVPLLNASGLPTHKAHATSLAIIFPLSVLSAGLYLFQDRMSLGDALPYLPLVRSPKRV